MTRSDARKRNDSLDEFEYTLTRRALRQIKAEAWDEGWAAAQEVVELDGMKVWAHTVFPEGYEGNPYRGA